jgi:SAM-dependent methyltransferase
MSIDIAYLEVAAAQIAHVKRRTYELMDAQAGSRVLDVGCGPGIDTGALALIVGSDGRVDGVDVDEEMITAARREADSAGVARYVFHSIGDACALPFDEATFDACRSERLFQHLTNPSRALDEMVRVTRPGGRVVVAETDWASLSIAGADPAVERKIVRMRPERTLPSGYVARDLRALFRRGGLLDVGAEAYAAVATDLDLVRQMVLLDEAERVALDEGVLSTDDIASWRADVTAAQEADEFYASLTFVVVAGRRSHAL